MSKIITNQLNAIHKKEQKILRKAVNPIKLSAKACSLAPKALENTLENAFAKAFEAMFVSGTGLIEKSFNKGGIRLDYDINNYAFEKRPSSKAIKNVACPSRKANLLNDALTTASGLSMGAMGIALPDVAVFIGVLLKGIYQTALSFGFGYESDCERVYILRLIRGALWEKGFKDGYDSLLSMESCERASLKDEINLTARALSNSMLAGKFVQGIPIIGAVGGAANHMVYKKVSALAGLEYKKRYLINKQKI